MARDNRSTEQIRKHYEIEIKLADRLRAADRNERKKLYQEVYNTFYSEIPDLPQISVHPVERQKEVDYLYKALEPEMNRDMVFLELGAGDCKLAMSVADKVKMVFVIEVSDEVLKNIPLPENFKLLVADSTEIEMEDETVDLIFSNQVMEHLHPDDAQEQLTHIHRILKEGGVYICMTPNRLSGPHDISKHFDDEARGLHLKEYTGCELLEILTSSGFRKVRPFVLLQGKRIVIPAALLCLFEGILQGIPVKLRNKLTNNIIMRKMLDIAVLGVK